MSNKNFTCIECNSVLGDPVTNEEIQSSNEYSDYIDRALVRSDDFYVSVWDKIMSAISAFGTIFIIYSIVNNNGPDLFIGVISFILCIIYALFPKFIWSIEKLRIIAFRFSEEPEPSDFYLVMVKIIKNILFFIGCGYVVTAVVCMVA